MISFSLLLTVFTINELNFKEIDMNQSPYDAIILKNQERARNGEFSEDGFPSDLISTDYADLYPLVYGRECGSTGIGKLREVALTKITKHEKNPLYREGSKNFHKWAVPYDSLDISKMQDQSAQYEEALTAAGVLVHRIAFPDPPVSAYGPMQYMWAARELLVLKGGSVIPKMGWSPLSVGRAEFLALWAFNNLGVPPILAITGKGVCEAGPCMFLAEDVFVGAISAAFNQDGIDQLYQTVQRTQGIDMTFLTLKCSSPYYFDVESGVSAHPDMVLGPLDLKKVIVYAGGIDYETFDWLKQNNYQIIEVDHDEQIQFSPTNVVVLEPGRVIMHAEATKAIAAVRKAGVDVVPVPYSEFPKAGGGVHCSTMEVFRETGPTLR